MTSILRLFLSLIVILIAALIGALAGLALVIGIGLATGVDTRDGGLAMGAAMGGGPLGTILGAALGLIAVIRWHRLPAGQPFLPPVALAGVIGVPVIVALGLGLRIWAITTPEFGSPHPDLIVELRVAKDTIDPADTAWKPLWPRYHRNGTYVGAYSLLEEREDGAYDYAVLRYVMVYRVEERALSLELDRDRFAYFPLDIGKTPEPKGTFTDWNAPAYTSYEPWREEPVRGSAEGLDMAIRYKVRWDGH